MPGRSDFEQSRDESSIPLLQRKIENQSVHWLLPAKPGDLEAVSYATASGRFGHDFSRIPVRDKASVKIQSKLAVNTSGDIYEQEADRISEQVMRMPEPQLQCASLGGGGCPRRQTEQLGQEHDRLQTRRVQPITPKETVVPPIVYEVLRSPGQPLDPATLDFMEPRFGYDFSRVRVHTDSSAVESAATIRARAYTSGHDVVFAAGKFQPETERGRWLLAHELTHVGQQTSFFGVETFATPNSGMIQMEPEEEIEKEPSAEEEATDREHSEALKNQIYDKYWRLVAKIAEAQVLGRTNRRHEWIDTLETKPATMLEVILAKQAPLSMWEVVPLYDMLNKLEEEVDAENAAAYALWQRAIERYSEERIRLEDEGDYESELALKFLDQAFDDDARRIDAIAATTAFVQEDILGLVYILDNRSHIKTANIVAERERKEIEARLDDLSEVQEESPGFLETAWSIVGCDSIGECLGDVALTVATAGTGKALKFVVKGTKAVKKARKARKVVRSTKKLGNTLHKFLKEAKALNRFISVVKGAAGDAANIYAKWLKKDWKKIATKISTDLIANYTTGEKQGAVTVSTARINKVFIETLVENELGIAKPDPKTIEVAIVFFLGKKHAVASSLARTFILRSLKFRTTVNLAFESIRAGTPLTEADEIFKRTVKSTIAEAAQDTVQAIPFVAESGLLKYITETIRKITQKIIG